MKNWQKERNRDIQSIKNDIQVVFLRQNILQRISSLRIHTIIPMFRTVYDRITQCI